MKISNLISDFSKIIPISEIRILLCKSLGLSLEDLLLNLDRELNDAEISEIKNLVSERVAGKPIAYITEIKEFYGYEFIVSESVLIPRPETEVIVDATKEYLKNFENPKILDLCTGSGCIAITLAKETDQKIIASDISDEALEILKQNISKHSVENLVEAVKSDWFHSFHDQKFDIITCNPPYIAFNEIYLMSEETKKFEPKISLFSGETGFESYEILAQNLHKFLNKSGIIIIECGANQSRKIVELFQENNLELQKIVKDLSGIERVISFRKI
jgi:release factor glutamine methyltransferase